MKINHFTEIVAWQKAKELSLMIYEIQRNNRDFGFRDQIQRAAVSIMNNIAEGFERFGNKEFKHFLYISKGSCAEVRSMLILGKELKYFSENQYKTADETACLISKLLTGFIRTL